MRDILKDRAKSVIERVGTNISLTTPSGLHAVRGIHRAPHASPQVGYGMTSNIQQDLLDILFDDVPDVERGSQAMIDTQTYDITQVEPDEYQVMARLYLVEAQA